MKTRYAVILLCGLAACQPVMPDSGALVEIPVRPVPGIGAQVPDPAPVAAVSEAAATQVQVLPIIVAAPATDERVSAVAFALATTHSVGAEMYRRPLIRFSRVEANCAIYRTPEEAQEAFLAAGGPERDRLNLDPDGDGFACRWDPAPIRAALRPQG
jgi:hypothetical protein